LEYFDLKNRRNSPAQQLRQFATNISILSGSNMHAGIQNRIPEELLNYRAPVNKKHEAEKER